MNRIAIAFGMLLLFGATSISFAQTNKSATSIHELFVEDQSDQQIDNSALSAEEQRKLRRRYDQREEAVKILMQNSGIRKAQDLFEAGVILTHSHVPENQLLAHLAFTAAAFDGIVEAKHLAATSLDRYLTFSRQTQLFGTVFQLPYRGWIHDVSPSMNDPIRSAFCVPSGKELDRLFELEKSGKVPPDVGHDEFWDIKAKACK